MHRRLLVWSELAVLIAVVLGVGVAGAAAVLLLIVQTLAGR